MDTFTPTSTSLETHLSTLSTLPLSSTIETLHALLPNLTPSVSPTATRHITHATIPGLADLNTLGRIYLAAAQKCVDDHAPLKTRLRHAALDKPIENLYIANNELLKKGLEDGSVKFPPLSEDEAAACPCCRGDPDAVILAGFVQEDALFFEEDEYRALFGEEQECGMQCGERGTWLKASREQVERKIREEEEGALSKL
ncbi:hypothetical protein BJX61DRAFT_335510 [Aspergillus egyptiacus]|nr:hypothetical protein BJX61DRAFT_335510 [Aspergillus egyptiacus]